MNNRIKVLRAEKNLSQQVTAEGIGISRVALNRIECGKTDPRGKTMMKISKFFGKPVDDIFLP